MNKIEDYNFEYYCGRCGDSGRIDGKRFADEKGDIIKVSYYGICPKCGDYIGMTDIYKFNGWEYLSKEDLQKFKNNT